MNYILLLGAGFTRNWGGPLAQEVFEQLLAHLTQDDDLRDLLWKTRDQGGFEAALTQLQEEFNRTKSAHSAVRLRRMMDAVRAVFAKIDDGLAQLTDIEPANDRKYLISDFLARFDAIFTLNLDLLLERHYFSRDISLINNQRWNGHCLPGTKEQQDPNRSPLDHTPAMRVADLDNFKIDPRLQPYIKLHGSSHFSTEDKAQMLILGGNKAASIGKHTLLMKYQECFVKYLNKPDTRLMVIGYSFADAHINETIVTAAKNGLRIMIVDPAGVDVLDKDKHRKTIPGPCSSLMEDLQPHIMTASRRPLLSTFSGKDIIEFDLMMKFFE